MKKRMYLENIFNDGLMDIAGDTAEEIRIRINEPIMIIYPKREVKTEMIYGRNEIENLIDRITKSSVYTYSDDIVNGFLTVEGGHRFGIAGTAVYEDNKLKHIKDISYINVRIARELKGVAEGVFSKILKTNGISNTLIISLPGVGKTTMIRDLTRLISENMPRYRVSVIDERNEISATFMGEPQNDIGKRTDVFCGYNKPDGIMRALRSMSPDVVVLDEIGGTEDVKAIMKCSYSGVKVIATMHGNSVSEVKRNIPELIRNNIFDYYIFLNGETRNLRILTAGDML